MRKLRRLSLAARRRLQRLAGGPVDPFADVPAGLNLSPSLRHFHDYSLAPLRLRFASGAFTDAAAWQQQARMKLAELAGFEQSAAVPGIVARQTFPLPGRLVRERIYLRARDGVDIPVHLIGPAAMPAAPRPVMLCLQGTNTGAHNSWGERKFPADFEKAGDDYAIALQAAAHGYLAVAIEQSCFGERAERQISPRSEAPCVDASMHAFLLGRSLLGERCSDVAAVINWLEAQSATQGIDLRRLHAMGHSSGGSVALFAAALDSRIQAVLACGCIGFIRETIGRRRDNQGQNVIPGILNWMEMGDILGLVAPRALVSVAGESDPIWPAGGAAAVFAEAREIHRKFGSENLLKLTVVSGGHHFRPTPSWDDFFSVLQESIVP